MSGKEGITPFRPTEVATLSLLEGDKFDWFLDHLTPTQQCILMWAWLLFDNEKGKVNWASVADTMEISRQAVDKQLKKIRQRADSLGYQVAF